jgi:RHS repeat-associated protein
VGLENPFRYRSYYYDTETGLYCLQSRYYDPEYGRFISEDDPSYHDGETGAAANLYTYCDNNPANQIDIEGEVSAARSIGALANKFVGGCYTSHNMTVFYYSPSSPQSKLGYCDAYDDMAWAAGCNITWLKTNDFTADGEQWRIELWKGSYAYGAMYGGEIGIYYRKSNYPSGWYRCAINDTVTMCCGQALL